MKKFIYILTIVSIVFTYLIIPSSALQEDLGSIETQGNYGDIRSYYVQNQRFLYWISPTYGSGIAEANVFVTSLTDYGVLRFYHVNKLDNGTYEYILTKQVAITTVGQVIDVTRPTPEKDTHYAVEVVHDNGEEIIRLDYIVTQTFNAEYSSIGSDYVYMYSNILSHLVDAYGSTNFSDGWNAYFDAYLSFFVDYMTSSPEAYKYEGIDLNSMINSWSVTMPNGQTRTLRGINLNTLYDAGIQFGYNLAGSGGGSVTKPTLDPIECDSVYKLTLNAGDKCVITFNETLASPRFKIYCDGQFPGGVTNAADMRAGYSYTYEAKMAGDHYFEFYDTVTSKQGKYTIYRILADGSPDYMQGFIDGMQHGSYSDGYNDGKNQGVVDGEANILNQMREYMIAQGLNPQGNSVESLLAYYASALNSNSNNNSGDWQDGYEFGYGEGYNDGVLKAEWEYKAGYSNGVDEGRRLTCNEIREYMYINGVDDGAITDNNVYSLLTHYDAQKGNGFSNIYNNMYEDLKDDIEKSTNEIKGSIDEEANGSFIQGFLAGMWNGMTGFISMILTGITFSGLSLMNILATAIGILAAAFVIKMIKG